MQKNYASGLLELFGVKSNNLQQDINKNKQSCNFIRKVLILK